MEDKDIEQDTAPELNMSMDLSFYARIDYLLGELNYFSSLVLGSGHWYSKVTDWRCSLDNLYKELYPLMTAEEKKAQELIRVSVSKINLIAFQRGNYTSIDVDKVSSQLQDWELSLRTICHKKGILLRKGV